MKFCWNLHVFHSILVNYVSGRITYLPHTFPPAYSSNPHPLVNRNIVFLNQYNLEILRCFLMKVGSISSSPVKRLVSVFLAVRLKLALSLPMQYTLSQTHPLHSNMVRSNSQHFTHCIPPFVFQHSGIYKDVVSCLACTVKLKSQTVAGLYFTLGAHRHLRSLVVSIVSAALLLLVLSESFVIGMQAYLPIKAMKRQLRILQNIRMRGL